MDNINLSRLGISQHRWEIKFVLIIFIAICVNFRVHAQEEDEPWKTPVNLSRSGAAVDPRIVTDSEGVLHVLWREDAANSFFYVRSEADQWSQVIPVEVPFGTDRYLREELGERFSEGTQVPLYNPELVASIDGRIHAFWLDEDNNLYHSSVASSDFGSYESWSPRQFISRSALSLSHVVDSEGTIHLIYVDNADTVESPAGVYYRRLSSSGENWSEPVALFESAYYRSASQENLNFQIRAGMPPGNTSGIYVVLDNRPLEEVLMIRSGDRGETWEDPVIIDRRQPDDPTSSVGPSQISLISNGEQLHLMWMAGHESTCQFFHQWSDDGGLNWQPAYAMEMAFNGCPADFWLMVDSNNLLYLLSSTSDRSYYLKAWNGEKWSLPEKQPVLSDFEDPITLRNVLLNCHMLSLDHENNMISASCGSSLGNQDIWFLERALGGMEDWFPTQPKTWNDPETLVSSENHLLEPLVFSGSDNLHHVFWISSGAEDETASEAEIFYTSWDGENWSRQIPLIHLNSKHADKLSGLFDRDEGLLLIWRDRDTNTYYYSVVKSEDILLPAEWSRPTTFPRLSSEAMFSAPAPFLNGESLLNIVFAVPLNENRGVYLMQSGEDDQTWSEPLTVVDAVAANWAMVDNPSVTQLENGDIHVIFTVYSLEPGPVSQALYYTRSEDDGKSWSEPELIAEGDIRWSQIVGVNPQSLLIAWQQAEDGQFSLWSRQSENGGTEWERPASLFDRLLTTDSFDLITQLHEHPYLVQVAEDQNGGLTLQERVWYPSGWQSIESYDLETRLEHESLLNLAGAISDNGQLLTIFNTQTTLLGVESQDIGFQTGNQTEDQQLEIVQSEAGISQNNLFFTDRIIDLSMQGGSARPVLVEELYSNPVSTPLTGSAVITDTSQAETMNDDQLDMELADMDSTTNNPPSDVVKVLIGLVPAILVLVLVLMIGVRRALPRQ